MDTTTTVRTLALTLIACTIPACAPASKDPGPAYPSTITQSGALDIHVFKTDTTVVFTNSTARNLPAGRLWLNGWWSAPTEPIPIGQAVEMPLDAFVDRDGDVFRGGGFFASRDPQRLVRAQLQTQDQLLGLVVVQDRVGAGIGGAR